MGLREALIKKSPISKKGTIDVIIISQKWAFILENLYPVVSHFQIRRLKPKPG